MLLGDSVKSVFVSGGAGFIGSHVVEALLADGYKVTAYDNLSNGRKEFVEPHLDNPNFTFVEDSMLNLDKVIESIKGHDLAWHLAANTDIIGCHDNPERDLHDCVGATFNICEAMRQAGVRDILFSSTGAVYGDLCSEVATSEATGPTVADIGICRREDR